MLDVVYNHFGPEGNYLGRYAPTFFTEAQTPWGSAIDYRVPEVRAFAIENALHWLRDYRFDGLRLDAVHTDSSSRARSRCCTISAAPSASSRPKPAGTSIWCWKTATTAPACSTPREDPPQRQVSRAVERRLSSRLARAADRRNAGLLRRLSATRRRAISRARWHPASSIRAKPPRIAAASCAASRAATLPPTAFINFLQNHDQIGNRALGDRLESVADAESDRGRAGDHAAGAR